MVNHFIKNITSINKKIFHRGVIVQKDSRNLFNLKNKCILLSGLAWVNGSQWFSRYKSYTTC